MCGMDWNAVGGITAILGLLGGVVGFVRSVLADRRSRAAEAAADDARADAAAALTKSADAEQRIAAAVEIIAGIQPGVAAQSLAREPEGDLSSLLRPRLVEWSVEKRTVDGSYRLRNVGTIDASVSIGRPGEARERAVAAGTALTFEAGSRASREVAITWTDAESTEHRRATRMSPE